MSTNPSNFAINANGILGKYGISSFSSYTSPLGVVINAPISQFSSANFNVSQATIQNIQSLIAKKTLLTQQRDQAVTALQAAPDTATAQKEQTIITALNGSIADVDASISQSQITAELQMQQNSSASNIQGAMNSSQAAVAFQQNVENGMVPNGSFNPGAPGDAQPANGITLTDYGYANDTTPDTNSANGIGNHDNQLTPYVSPNQVASAALSSNVAAQYGVSQGQTFQFTAQNGSTYNLRYDDTAPEPNRVDIYAPSGTLGGNNFSAKGSTISPVN